MRISHVAITNLARFEAFEANIPAITLIEGDNGEGKTSLIAAIKYAFARGHDPDIIHAGAEWGAIVLTFDDTSQVKARASNKGNETTRGYKAPGAKKFTVTREQIDAMANALSYDPLAFMDMPEKEQVEKILKIMPVQVEQEELMAAVGDAADEAAGANIVAGMNGLDIINVLHAAIYKARTACNTASDTQEKHALELEKALPPPADKGHDHSSQAAALASDLRQAEQSQAAKIAELGEQFAALKEREHLACSKAEAAADQEYEQQLKSIEAKRASTKSTAQNKCAQAIEAGRSIANTEASSIKAEYKPKIDSLFAAHATAAERARSEQQAEGTRAAAKVAREESLAKKARSQALTQALDRLADLKKTVAGRLKIPGVHIEEGRIWRAEGGEMVPFKAWNTASKMILCLKIAVMAHGEAGFILVDGAERIGPKNWEGMMGAMKKYAQDKGVQFVIGKISPGELRVGAAPTSGPQA